MKKIIYLLVIVYFVMSVGSIFATEIALQDFKGKYSLIENFGDDQQFSDPCKEIINVEVIDNNLERLIKSEYFSFVKIGQGKYKDRSEYGTRKTYIKKNSVINKYRAFKFPNFYTEVRKLTLLDDGMTLVLKKTSSDDPELRCVWKRVEESE